jgi:hypothetical protein
MSEKTPSPKDPIRVSLRFGARSDITLVQQLREIQPYQRPKFLRGLIKEGWRLRRPKRGDSTTDRTASAEGEQPLDGSPLSQPGRAIE